MTTEERIALSKKLWFMNPEDKKAYIDSGVFNEIIEAYMKEYLSRMGINKTTKELHEEFKAIFDTCSAEDVLKKRERG